MGEGEGGAAAEAQAGREVGEPCAEVQQRLGAAVEMRAQAGAGVEWGMPATGVGEGVGGQGLQQEGVGLVWQGAEVRATQWRRLPLSRPVLLLQPGPPQWAACGQQSQAAAAAREAGETPAPGPGARAARACCRWSCGA